LQAFHRIPRTPPQRDDYGKSAQCADDRSVRTHSNTADSTALRGESMVTTVVVENRPSTNGVSKPQRQSAQASRAKSRQVTSNAADTDELSASERYHQISLCAYYRAQQRGFAAGHMWDDWLAAEQEVAARTALKQAGERGEAKP
jgi:hypothetical protein